MTIVNIRGPNGSGKSTLVRSLFTDQDRVGKVITQAGLTVPVRINPSRVAVVGPYRTACGGCDGVKTQDAVCDAVRGAMVMADHVVFEGVVVSTIFKRYLDLSRELGGMVWAYLDTPLDVCLERVYRRNGGKPIKEDLVRDKFTSIARTCEKAEAAGERVLLLPWKDPLPTLLGVLK